MGTHQGTGGHHLAPVAAGGWQRAGDHHLDAAADERQVELEGVGGVSQLVEGGVHGRGQVGQRVDQRAVEVEDHGTGRRKARAAQDAVS